MLATIRVRLILLVLIIAVPLIVANLFVINQLASGQSDAQKETLVGTTRALASAVDAELKKYAVLGYSMATSTSLEEGNFERFHARATDAVKELPGSWVAVADIQGQQLVNTLRPFGAKLPYVIPLDVYQRALATRTSEVGDVGIGPVAQRPAIGIFIPIIRDGIAKFGIVVGLDVGVFADVLKNQRLSTGWVAGIGDRQSNFVARSVDNERYVGKQISKGWRDASRLSDEGLLENISKEGTPLVSAFSNLSQSGWTVSVGASKTLLSTMTRQSLWIVAIVSSSLVLFSLTLAWIAARQIDQSMTSLEKASSALLQNEPINVRRTGLREVDHALAAFESAATSILDRQRRHSLLVDELNHRVKNTLSVVQSMAILAKQSATNVADFTESFVSRVVSLAHTHDLLTERSWAEVEMRQIFESELCSYQDAHLERVSLNGDAIFLNAKDAVAVSMIIHELATNAAKYGALSNTAGRLKISWTEPAQNVIQIIWKEENGPPVYAPQHKSFGTKLIKSLMSGLAGVSTTDFFPDGLHFSMTFTKSDFV